MPEEAARTDLASFVAGLLLFGVAVPLAVPLPAYESADDAAVELASSCGGLAAEPAAFVLAWGARPPNIIAAEDVIAVPIESVDAISPGLRLADLGAAWPPVCPATGGVTDTGGDCGGGEICAVTVGGGGEICAGTVAALVVCRVPPPYI